MARTVAIGIQDCTKNMDMSFIKRTRISKVRNHVYIVKPLQWRDRTKIDAMKVVLNGRLRL